MQIAPRGKFAQRIGISQNYYRYNSREIGWKLRNLGLLSRHSGTRKTLRFSRDVRRRIHRLAAQFGLQLPKVADCEDCKEM